MVTEVTQTKVFNGREYDIIEKGISRCKTFGQLINYYEKGK